ncbi:MAG TPA: hypothetical protein VKE74_18435 [Gemmataceae bacterium]|nr:hypothetical protein [Gemmataceae bacterium]
MDVASRQDFLACLDRCPDRNGLEVFAHAKRHLIAALDEVDFDEFRGPDYEVIGRLTAALRDRETETALWGLAFVDLWYCSNFGRPHWAKLVSRDPANVRYAIEAAHRVFAVSGADGGPALAAIINQCRCWAIAEQYVPRAALDWEGSWWQGSVSPHRKRE